jgi:flagellar protein FlaG
MNVSNISRVIIDKVDNINRSRQENNSKPDDAKAGGDEYTKALSSNDIHEAVGKLNNALGAYNERVSFEYREKINRVIVRIVDSQTNEVVREMPPKDVIKLLEHIQEYMGMLVDESR